TVVVKAPEVIVASPANSSGAASASLNSPVHVVASGFSGYTVTAMQVYLDGKLTYQVRSSNVDTLVNMAAGAHTLIVKGWDASGRNFMNTLSVGIVSNQPPTAVLSTSVTSLLVGGSVTASTSGSTDPDGTIAAISINFGDGSAPAGSTITTSTVHVAGSAFSGYAIALTQNYIYGVLKANATTSTIDAVL